MNYAESSADWPKNVDECVRYVTAFRDFDDLCNTEPTYAPSFYPGRHSSGLDKTAMRVVCEAFNAKFAGQRRPAMVRS